MAMPHPIAPRHADDPTQAHARFAEALAAVHGLRQASPQGGSNVTNAPVEAVDLAEAEMRAMVRAYLGDGYDESKTQALVADQRDLQRYQAALLESYERGEVGAHDYALKINESSRVSADFCRRVLGADDFDRLFGYVPETLIDADEFVAREDPSRPPQATPAAVYSDTRGTPAAESGPLNATTLRRAKLIEMLFSIVEEKTGYPRDMVGLDQNLESDLGIDSIKRIEIVGAMLQALPEAYRSALTESRSKLNTASTLNGMLDLLMQEQWVRVTSTEIAHGAGPGERNRADARTVREKPVASIGPLLGGATISARPTGDQVVALKLDARHLYLQEYVIDGTPVLPAAAALEMLSEAATAVWPGWKAVEVRDFKLMKVVELKEPTKALQVVISPPPYGSSEGFEINAALQTDLGNGRGLTHYKGVIRFEQRLSVGQRSKPGVHHEKSLTPAKAYGEWLLHGPRFQVIDDITGLSQAGSGAKVHSTHPSLWLKGTASDSAPWLFDPALLDAAAQMAWLWARAFRGESALPVKFGRVVRYREQFPARLHMEYEHVYTDDPAIVRANVLFSDEAGEPVMLIEELESIASAALNRLSGTARTAVETPE